MVYINKMALLSTIRAIKANIVQLRPGEILVAARAPKRPRTSGFGRETGAFQKGLFRRTHKLLKININLWSEPIRTQKTNPLHVVQDIYYQAVTRISKIKAGKLLNTNGLSQKMGSLSAIRTIAKPKWGAKWSLYHSLQASYRPQFQAETGLREMIGGLVLDFDAAGNVVGIDIGRDFEKLDMNTMDTTDLPAPATKIAQPRWACGAGAAFRVESANHRRLFCGVFPVSV